MKLHAQLNYSRGPKIPKKTNHYGWFFYICNQFDKQTVTHHSLFIFCYQNVQTTPA
ncbi:hypothetical protein AB98_1959 [Escherichia coli 1-176-05_S3_C1]|nr:hypothetical protein AB98_1959 [Escherichia coli 1-176-05_S3_C1]